MPGTAAVWVSPTVRACPGNCARVAQPQARPQRQIQRLPALLAGRIEQHGPGHGQQVAAVVRAPGRPGALRGWGTAWRAMLLAPTTQPSASSVSRPSPSPPSGQPGQFRRSSRAWGKPEAAARLPWRGPTGPPGGAARAARAHPRRSGSSMPMQRPWGSNSGTPAPVAGVVVKEMLAPVEPNGLQAQRRTDGGGAHSRFRQVDTHAANAALARGSHVRVAMALHRRRCRVRRSAWRSSACPQWFGSPAPAPAGRAQQVVVLLLAVVQRRGADGVKRHAPRGLQAARQAALPGPCNPRLHLGAHGRRTVGQQASARLRNQRVAVSSGGARRSAW